MQTFLPYADFELSAKVLDSKRLGKQRIEARDVLYIISRLEDQENLDWLPVSLNFPLSKEELRERGDKIFRMFKNHPCCRMWLGHKEALVLYYDTVVREWKRRGYKHTLKLFRAKKNPPMPWWIGYEPFHLSHQSNLLRKNPSHYGQFFPSVPSNLAYVWPIDLPQIQAVISISSH